MTDSTINQDGLPKMPSGPQQSKVTGVPRDLRSGDERLIRIAGLAVVTFDTVSEFDASIDEEVDFITELEDLRFVEGLPAPDVIIDWLLTDMVLVDCGEPIGLVPMQRYAEAGLFKCGVSRTLSPRGLSSPVVSLGVLPQGVMWLKQHYIPTPERHRRDYIPQELRDSLD